MEPKRLSNPKFPYDKPSDIYSFGVLMWEISSGKFPFENYDDLILLRLAIIDGERETKISGTPEEYENLYKNCWKQEPEQRPTIGNVLSKLEKMNDEIKSKGMCNIFTYFYEVYCLFYSNRLKLFTA
jgi:serine/threonine protein kinase